MNSTLQKLIQSLGFKQDIDNLKSNTTEGVDSISEVYDILLQNVNRIDNSIESISGVTSNFYFLTINGEETLIIDNGEY